MLIHSYEKWLDPSIVPGDTFLMTFAPWTNVGTLLPGLIHGEPELANLWKTHYSIYSAVSDRPFVGVLKSATLKKDLQAMVVPILSGTNDDLLHPIQLLLLAWDKTFSEGRDPEAAMKARMHFGIRVDTKALRARGFSRKDIVAVFDEAVGETPETWYLTHDPDQRKGVARAKGPVGAGYFDADWGVNPDGSGFIRQNDGTIKHIPPTGAPVPTKTEKTKVSPNTPAIGLTAKQKRVKSYGLRGK